MNLMLKNPRKYLKSNQYATAILALVSIVVLTLFLVVVPCYIGIYFYRFVAAVAIFASVAVLMYYSSLAQYNFTRSGDALARSDSDSDSSDSNEEE
jgi:hypothetical protein